MDARLFKSDWSTMDALLDIWRSNKKKISIVLFLTIFITLNLWLHDPIKSLFYALIIFAVIFIFVCLVLLLILGLAIFLTQDSGKTKCRGG
jgi:hypothetical protein